MGPADGIAEYGGPVRTNSARGGGVERAHPEDEVKFLNEQEQVGLHGQASAHGELNVARDAVQQKQTSPSRWHGSYKHGIQVKSEVVLRRGRQRLQLRERQ